MAGLTEDVDDFVKDCLDVAVGFCSPHLKAAFDKGLADNGYRIVKVKRLKPKPYKRSTIDDVP